MIFGGREFSRDASIQLLLMDPSRIYIHGDPKRLRIQVDASSPIVRLTRGTRAFGLDPPGTGHPKWDAAPVPGVIGALAGHKPASIALARGMRDRAFRYHRIHAVSGGELDETRDTLRTADAPGTR